MKQHSIATKLNTKLDRIEQRSRKDPEATFNNLGHAIDLDLLRTCYSSLDASKAVGVDEIAKKQYGRKLESATTPFADPKLVLLPQAFTDRRDSASFAACAWLRFLGTLEKTEQPGLFSLSPQ